MGDFWIVDSQISGAIGLDSSAGRKPEDFKAFGLSYKDMRPGSYDPKARLEDMDLDGVDAEVLYFGGPVTQYPKDPELRRYIVQRYNDWMVELSKAAPTRLVGLGAHPAGRPRRGRCAELGAHRQARAARASTATRSPTSAAASRCGTRPTSRSGRSSRRPGCR